jgi:beta-glucosidase
VENSALYPFGYGLSYTDFEYSNISLSTDRMSQTDSLQVTVTVSNTGGRGGQEVVQLYIRDLFASVTRPVMELRGFEKISLDVGESSDVTFTLGPDHLSFYNHEMEKVVEPGRFKVFVGTSSAETLEAEFEITE